MRDILRNRVSIGLGRFVSPLSLEVCIGDLILRCGDFTTSPIGVVGLDPGASLRRIRICSLSSAGDLLDVAVYKSVSALALIPSILHKQCLILATV
jgi:hypothetical protein